MTIKSGMNSTDELFIQGRYLSIGINEDGTLGTKKNAPDGFSTDWATGLKRVGLYGDMDGFGRGSKALDDALLQGRAIEGFNIGYKLDGKTFVQSNQTLTGYYEVDGTLSNKSSSSVGQANWNGVTTEKLAVAQKITLADDAKHIRIDVTLTNNSGETMSDLRYMRTFDPDQSDKYATVNRIERQGDGGALVSSKLQDANAQFFLFSEDSRAVVSAYGFVNTDPYAPEAWGSAQKAGTTKDADVTTNITFALGTLKAGQSTTVTLYMGVTDELASTIRQIETGSDGDGDDDDDDDGDDGDDGDDEDNNEAPVVADDRLTLKENGRGSGNVLSNDRDPDGDKLTASLKSGPANGTVSLNKDGSFVYTPKSGFSGSDSFTYAAFDGQTSATATVRLTIEAAPPPTTPTPGGDLLTRPGLVDGSSSASQTLTGAAYTANTFYFDVNARSGNDFITNFGKNDVLVFNDRLYDGNRDGFITLFLGTASIDGPGSSDTFTILNGVSALRYLGNDDNGLAVYADASVRPGGAKEGTLADDRLSGDSSDNRKDMFFFDTALGADLGADQLIDFGRRDVIVTTTRLEDGNGDGLIVGKDGSIGLAGAGSVAIRSTGGATVDTLEFDGAATRDGVEYFVYSLAGSSAGTADFAAVTAEGASDQAALQDAALQNEALEFEAVAAQDAGHYDYSLDAALFEQHHLTF